MISEFSINQTSIYPYQDPCGSLSITGIDGNSYWDDSGIDVMAIQALERYSWPLAF